MVSTVELGDNYEVANGPPEGVRQKFKAVLRDMIAVFDTSPLRLSKDDSLEPDKFYLKSAGKVYEFGMMPRRPGRGPRVAPSL